MKIVVFAVSSLALLACAPGSQPPDEAEQTPSVPVPAYPADPVGQWMECEECQDGELQSVAALAGAAVDTLRSLLQQGPPAERLAALERSLRASYARAGASESESAYVARYRSNYETKYRTRAVQALSAIATPEALGALTAFDTVPARPEVREAIRRAMSNVR